MNKDSNSLKFYIVSFAIIFAVIAICAFLDKGENNVEDTTEVSTEVVTEQSSDELSEEEKMDEQSEEVSDNSEETAVENDVTFRNEKLLNEHFEKHGKEMGFSSAKEYETAAKKVVNNPNALHKIEKEDGDDVYYLEDTNEFVIVSTDGYIRTYFYPSGGIDYYNRQ